MEGRPLGVRKGAWTGEEDLLLKKCIEKYGEGKWYQIPIRAGLNRCRKSCRLRWLNYLRPNIKRGEFTLDEIDLIMRLHKLLGNRWSLIAGRLPGRTANDVKNYWNTRTHQKSTVSNQEEVKGKTQKKMEANKIIKPRPRTLIKKNPPWLREKYTLFDNIQLRDNVSKPSPATPPLPQPDEIEWWERLLVDKEGDKVATCSISESDEDTIASLWAEEIAATSVVEAFVEKNQSCWNEFSFNDLWDFLSVEQETTVI